MNAEPPGTPRNAQRTQGPTATTRNAEVAEFFAHRRSACSAFPLLTVTYRSRSGRPLPRCGMGLEILFVDIEQADPREAHLVDRSAGRSRPSCAGSGCICSPRVLSCHAVM